MNWGRYQINPDWKAADYIPAWDDDGDFYIYYQAIKDYDYLVLPYGEVYYYTNAPQWTYWKTTDKGITWVKEVIDAEANHNHIM